MNLQRLKEKGKTKENKQRTGIPGGISGTQTLNLHLHAYFTSSGDSSQFCSINWGKKKKKSLSTFFFCHNTKSRVEHIGLKWVSSIKCFNVNLRQ